MKYGSKQSYIKPATAIRWRSGKRRIYPSGNNALQNCGAAEIDKINILRASILAMHRAVDGLKTRPQHLLIDGNKGYPTAKHRAAIREYGVTPHHRLSFNLLGEEPKQLTLSFE